MCKTICTDWNGEITLKYLKTNKGTEYTSYTQNRMDLCKACLNHILEAIEKFTVKEIEKKN
jgi:hypothetical protein